MACSCARPVSHAAIRSVDVTQARAMPGVLGVFTGRDLATDGLGAIPPVAVFPGRDGKPMFAAAMPLLAVDRIRYVGERVAIVVARDAGAGAGCSRARARSISTSSPCAPMSLSATASGASRSTTERPGNIALDWTDGERRHGRGRLRERRPCRARAARRHAACAGLAGAALRHRPVGRGEADATR